MITVITLDCDRAPDFIIKDISKKLEKYLINSLNDLIFPYYEIVLKHVF